MHLFDWLAFCFCRLDEFGSTAKFTTTTGQTVELGKPAREVSPIITILLQNQSYFFSIYDVTLQKTIIILLLLLISEILIRNIIRVKTTDIL